MNRQLHLGLFIYPGGHHIAAWRHPQMQPERITALDYYIECAQLAERGKFDLFFVGDALNVLANAKAEWWARSRSTISIRSRSFPQ